MRWLIVFIALSIPSLTFARCRLMSIAPPDGAIVTGADSISGWTCEATSLQIRFDNGPLIDIPYGGTRGDTVGACGDDNNSFSLAWNWAVNGPGPAHHRDPERWCRLRYADRHSDKLGRGISYRHLRNV